MADSHPKPTVVYVAGVSRSGSTMLDMALGSNSGFVSVGEMRRLQGYARRDWKLSGARSPDAELRCTCGEYLDECSFWQDIERASGLSLGDTPFRSAAGVSSRRAMQTLYMGAGGHGVRAAARVWGAARRELSLARNCFRVYDALGAVLGPRYIVDSSKSIYHYALLRSHSPGRMRLLVVHRDGRAVTHSMIRGDRASHWPPGEAPARQAARLWGRQVKLLGLLSAHTADDEKLTVHYEALCTDPMGQFARVGSMLGASGIEPHLTSDGKHNVGGSPSRLEGRNDIRLDESWRTGLSDADLDAFEQVAGSLNRKLGYE